MSLLILGGSDLGRAAEILQERGWAVFSGLPLGPIDPRSNLAVIRFPPVAELLRTADRQGLAYQLIHLGPDDGEPEGTYQRAHHRAAVDGLPALVDSLRTSDRFRLQIMSFGFKAGIPAQAQWVFDVRFLDNPYWIPELKALTGLEAAVEEYVLGQAPAVTFMATIESLLVQVIPEFKAHGKVEATIALGCTGGRHRSVALAASLGSRLSAKPDLDVEVRHRELGG